MPQKIYFLNYVDFVRLLLEPSLPNTIQFQDQDSRQLHTFHCSTLSLKDQILVFSLYKLVLELAIHKFHTLLRNNKTNTNCIRDHHNIYTSYEVINITIAILNLQDNYISLIFLLVLLQKKSIKQFKALPKFYTQIHYHIYESFVDDISC